MLRVDGTLKRSGLFSPTTLHPAQCLLRQKSLAAAIKVAGTCIILYLPVTLQWPV